MIFFFKLLNINLLSIVLCNKIEPKKTSRKNKSVPTSDTKVSSTVFAKLGQALFKREEARAY